MRILVWLTEGTWPACVDAVAQVAGAAESEVVLLHVIDPGPAETAHGAFAGLVGRGRHALDPGDVIDRAAERAERTLLQAAQERLGRPALLVTRRGRTGQEIIRAAADADLLVAARDGDHSRLGPASLGPATRFVVDHAPCQVLLVWPDQPPGIHTLPPAPPPRP